MTTRVKHPTTIDMFTFRLRYIEVERVAVDKFLYWGVTTKRDVGAETIEFGPFHTRAEANEAIDAYLWKGYVPKSGSASSLLMRQIQQGYLKR